MITIDNEAQMLAMAAKLAGACSSGIRLHLHGELGAGKTTFARGFLQGLGHQGLVKSPTYTLVEPYRLQNMDIYHFDLYRINDQAELLDIGIEDYFHDNSLCIIEWAEKAKELLLAATISITIKKTGLTTRALHCCANDSVGRALLSKIGPTIGEH